MRTGMGYMEFGDEVKQRKSPAEEEFYFQLKHVLKLDPVCEYRFHPTRKWRSDIALPHRMILIEIDGGVFTNGRHTRGKGFVNDMEKINEAQRLGYRVFRFIPEQVKNGQACKFIEDVIENEC